VKRLKVIGKNIVVVSSAKDTRSPDEVLKTHDNVSFKCIKVYDLFDVLHMDEFDEADILAIDEAQFFPRLKKFVDCAMYVNKDLIIAGLDADSFQMKFGEIHFVCGVKMGHLDPLQNVQQIIKKSNS
jgi:thymidine kinase